jgi:hypothetical protein
VKIRSARSPAAEDRTFGAGDVATQTGDESFAGIGGQDNEGCRGRLVGSAKESGQPVIMKMGSSGKLSCETPFAIRGSVSSLGSWPAPMSKARGKECLPTFGVSWQVVQSHNISKSSAGGYWKAFRPPRSCGVSSGLPSHAEYLVKAVELKGSPWGSPPSESLSRARTWWSISYIEKGQDGDALSDIEKWRDGPEGEPAFWEVKAYTDGRARDLEKAQEALKKWNRELDPGVFVFANLGVGNEEEAIAWLKKGYAQHSNILATLKVEPAFDPLRSDPRFQELLQRVGLAQ